MKALLLCAGVGSRLRPLTDVLPKCLVPIRGRPLLSYWLNRLSSAGFDEIIVNTHHHAEMVRAYVEASPWSPLVRLTYEETLLGTGGTILSNQVALEDSPFLVAHADNLTVFDPKAFFSAFKNRPERAQFTMMTFRTDQPESCGILALDMDGVVQSFHEKVSRPPGNLANAAVYFFTPSIVKYLKSMGKSNIDLSTEVIPEFVGRISTFENLIYHRDIGTLESLTKAQETYPVIENGYLIDQSWLQLLRRCHEVVSTLHRLGFKYY